jgi:cytochrome b pre-mRNA-processing protein 3
MMAPARWFRPKAEAQAGRELYASAAGQARQPGFYTAIGAPDTVEGRFELFSLHVALLLLRLKGQGKRAAEVAQQLFETYVRSLDDALREMGVGDVMVGKRMRKLGEAFYGRMRSYELALAQRPDLTELQALVARTVLEAAPQGRAEALAGYAAQAADTLDGLALDDLLAGRAAWPEAPA